MGKLGYTWYPKDWGNSESVFEMNLIERGLYRELIDLAMFNDNKTEVKLEVWSRKFAISIVELNQLIDRLLLLKVIIIKNGLLFIPSCESRLNLVRGGSNGGKKSKPNRKPTPKPLVSLDENKLKPIPKQIESKVNIKENKINNEKFADETFSSQQWCEQLFMKHKIIPENIKKVIEEFSGHLIIKGAQKISTEDFKDHLSNWLRLTNLSEWQIKNTLTKTNQIGKTAKDYGDD